MEIYWLEQTEADVPATSGWLNPAEAERARAMRFPRRRADWLLGRWTAKLAVAASLARPVDHPALAAIEIRTAPSGAPEVYVANEPAAVRISLSHRAGRAVCALVHGAAPLGCDLELVEPRDAAFLTDYFTSEEQETVAHAPAPDRSRLVTVLWSAKESALKALGTGLRLDTRSVVVRPVEGAGGWQPLEIRCTGGQAFHGWWRETGNLVRTLVAAPAAYL